MTKRQLQDLARLARRSERAAQGRFLVEGVRSVEAAVLAGAPLDVVVASHDAASTRRVDAVLHRAADAGAAIEVVPGRDLERIGDARTSQGVLAVARRVVRSELARDAGRVLLLDGVQDPGNVGTLVRTAAWFGLSAVVADARSADFEAPKTVRASMGGLWDVALVRVDTLGPVLAALAGREVWGADLGGTPLASWAPPPRAALVLGSEAHGLSPETAAALTGRVTIPGGGDGVESLNVTIAGGILMATWAGRAA